MRFLRQSLTGLFLAALSLGVLVYAGALVNSAIQETMNRESKSRPMRERSFAVNVIRAKAGPQAPVLESFGEVKSRRTLELRAAAAGRVIALSEQFVDGGRVQAGELLLRVDPANAQSVLARVRADIADAQAEARDAERSLALAMDELAAAQEQAGLREKAFKRQSDLFERGVGTAAAVEAAELAASGARQSVLSRRQAVAQSGARIDQAASALSRAQIALEDAKRGLADTEMKAPFAGVIHAPSVVAGRLVGLNERLGELIDPEALEVSLRVSTAQYARLLNASGEIIDAPVRAVLDVAGVDLIATGRITRAGAGTGEGQTGRLLFARLEEAVGFKTGDFVRVYVQEPEIPDVVRLPSAAMDASGTVLVLGAGNRLEALPVELVRRQGDDILVRAEGLEGRDVVKARTPLLGAGIVVKPLRPDTEQAAAPSMVKISKERRDKLIAFIQANKRMPEAAKARVLEQLNKAEVPARMLERLESRMEG